MWKRIPVQAVDICLLAGASADIDVISDVLSTFVASRLSSCRLHPAQARDATAAIQQARGSAHLAKWSEEKVVLGQIGKLAQQWPGNKARDLTRELHSRGLMLKAPISWLCDVSWRH